MMNFFKKMKISTKITLSVSLLLLFALGTLGGLALVSSSRGLLNNINLMLEDRVKDGAKFIATSIETQMAILEDIAAREDIRSMDWEIQSPVLSEEMKRLGFIEMQVIDLSGVSRSLTNSMNDFSNSIFCQNALQGVTNISVPVIQADKKRTEIVIATPIKKSGNIRGALVATIDGIFLSRIVEDIKIGSYQSAYGFLMNSDGTTIAHPNYELVLIQDNDFKNIKTDQELYELVELEKKMSNGETGVGSYVYNKESKFMAYAPVQGTTWSLALTIPVDDLFQTVTSLQLRLIFLTILFIVIGIGISVLLSNSISKPILLATNQLNEGAGQIAEASNQLSAASQQLSQGSAEQASAIEETSATLQETATMIQQSTTNTKQAARLSEKATDSADKGNNEMEQMLKSMEDIKESSDQIAKIIKVIDDIAFQTNILALNAAVEAARAGEAGMGFAVVAEEVRNLAGRSAQAAKDTAAIIEANIEISNQGVSVAERVGQVLKEIMVQSKKVSDLMEEISAASQEQTQGVNQVNQAMSQIETVTQQNATNAEQSAAASEELNSQADSMRRIVQQLSQLVNGTDSIGDKKAQNYGNRDHQTTYSANRLTVGTNRQNNAHQNSEHRNNSVTDRLTTKVISPENVIPLEKDSDQF